MLYQAMMIPVYNWAYKIVKQMTDYLDENPFETDED